MHRTYVFRRESVSTNTELKERVKTAQTPVFDVLCAQIQSGGRGRQGKSFYSPAGGLYFSAVYPFTGEETNAPFFTLLAGLAAAEALEALTGADIRIKWPNDLYLNGKKLGGILTELVSGPAGNAAVVGFGINLKLQKSDFPAELRETATALAAEGLPVPGRKTAVKRIVTLLDEYCYTLAALAADTAPYAEKINERAFLTNRRVKILCGDTETQGTVAGIAPDGCLKLRTQNGIERVRSGNVIIMKNEE